MTRSQPVTNADVLARLLEVQAENAQLRAVLRTVIDSGPWAALGPQHHRLDEALAVVLDWSAGRLGR